MVDVAKILRLVEEGVLSAAEADDLLAALDTAPPAGRPPADASDRPEQAGDRPRHLRIEITDHGRRVVNLRVPINIASLAAGLVPGLPDAEAERIRASIRAGMRGPIVDVGAEDGERVLIISE
jgi:hypothetical protein